MPISFRINDVMRSLSEKVPVPRIENIFRLAAKEIWKAYEKKQCTELIDEAVWFFIRSHKHQGHQWLQHHDLKGVSSADVGSWYADDMAFFSQKGFVIQELLFIKEAMILQSISGNDNIEDYIEQRLRTIEVATPDVVSDILYGTYIPFTPHFSITEPRPNTEILFLG
jgi:hypothetical protein